MKESAEIELLNRLMRNEASPEEVRQLCEWYKANGGGEELDAFYSRRWDESKRSTDIDSEIQQRMYNRIRAQIKEQSKSRKPQIVVLRNQFLRYAAIILLLLAVGLGSHLYTRSFSQKMDNSYLVSVDKGQRANVTLPDGTKVWLNSHSSLSYKSDYGSCERRVILEGEAFFEVAKDVKHRFVVDVGKTQVEALGTSFNVKAYSEDKNIVTTLYTGSVRVSTPISDVVIEPGEQAMVNTRTLRTQVDRPEMLEYASMWRDNELAFTGQTLEEIAEVLNRMYNICIVFEDETIKKSRFSGVIRNNSLDNVIEIISLTASIEYRSVGDTVVLSKQKQRRQ
ncbi:MAG: FecR family protein [Bacteroidales bacterium]